MQPHHKEFSEPALSQNVSCFASLHVLLQTEESLGVTRENEELCRLTLFKALALLFQDVGLDFSKDSLLKCTIMRSQYVKILSAQVLLLHSECSKLPECRDLQLYVVECLGLGLLGVVLESLPLVLEEGLHHLLGQEGVALKEGTLDRLCHRHAHRVKFDGVAEVLLVIQLLVLRLDLRQQGREHQLVCYMALGSSLRTF